MNIAWAAMMLAGLAGLQSADVEARLAKAAEVSRGEGLAPTGWAQRGQLGEGAKAGFTLRLERGRAYQFVGACGGGCSDLDLQLLDAAGNQVDMDDQPDDLPVVVVTPPRGQTYTLRVTMSGCPAAACGYGVVGFAK